MTDAILIGAGQRGHHIYGRWALDHPDRLRIVAVADPRPDRLERFADAHGIPASHAFGDPDALLAMPRIAPAAIIASPDRTHHRHVLAALRAGYHVLAEKPMAVDARSVRRTRRGVGRSPGTLHIGHVLRFTPFFQTLREVDPQRAARRHRDGGASGKRALLAHGPFLRPRQLGKGRTGHTDDRRQVLPRLRHSSLESRLARHSPFLGGIAVRVSPRARSGRSDHPVHRSLPGDRLSL